MATTYVSDWTGLEIDEAVGLVLNNYKSVMPIGIEIDNANSSPSVTRIDLNSNEITLDTSDFDAHTLWGNIGRCTIDPATNVPVYGTNARGDGLTLDGSTGNVMVRIPKFYYKYETVGNYQRFWVSPTNLAGFVIHPMFVQRGGIEKDEIFISAYEAAGFLDVATFKLRSITGVQPVTGSVSYTNLPADRLTLDDAEGYGNNIGSGYGICNPWTYAALQLLIYIEFGTRDIQTALGRGVVDLASGTLYAGKNTGEDSADTNIGTNGTGTGTGINGETPTVWRGLENLASGGNVWEFIAGINMYLSDGSVRILNPDGTGTPSATIADGDYIILPGTGPSTDGYISGIQADQYGALAFIPATSVGSSSTHYADYFYHPMYSPSVVLFGGNWTDGSRAGVGDRFAYEDPASSYRTFGARLEYIPQ